jgi:DEAD/DEAH box helicase domain-containing protein
MAYELAKRTADAEQKLATRDGLPARDGALLSARLQRRYQDRITGSFAIPGREGRYAPFPMRYRRPWPRP